MKFNLEDVRTRKTGTEYLVLKLPKEIIEELPDPCYIDIEIKDVRSGISSKPIKKKKKRR